MNIDRVYPKQHIEEICNDHKKSSERTLDGYAGSIEVLEKSFSKKSHFIMEFIQNADYSTAHNLMIKILDDKIQILNDGRQFTPKDVESICKVGRSLKAEEGYIGYLGVGFKSVFLISNNPQIYSSPYYFKFDKNQWSNVEKLPWQIMPIWVDEVPSDIHDLLKKWNTVFIIPVKNPEKLEPLRSEIVRERLTPKILLFLQNIEQIIIDDVKNYRYVSKKDIGNGIYSIIDKSNGGTTIERWIVFPRICEVPSDIKEDPVTEHWKRHTVKQREAIVAFRLSEENELDEEVKGTAHVGAFSYLPLKEENVGLKFLMHADFLMGAGREVIDREALWNKWLLKEIFNLIVEKCIPEFKNNEKWKFNFTKVLYPEEWGHELFDEHIKKPLRVYLESNPNLIAEDGSYIKMSEAIRIETDIRDLLTEKDLRTFYPNKKVLHPKCQTTLNIDEAPSNVYTFIVENIGRNLISQKSKSGDVQWFKKLYIKLGDYNPSKLVHEDIILTNTNEIVSSEKVYIKTEKLSVPPEIEGNFKFVHPQLIEDSYTLNFLKNLKVEELTEKHIQDILQIEQLPKIKENWKSMSDREKIGTVKSCKDWWENGDVKIQDLNFLTLKMKTNMEWLSPNELIFPKDYNPFHNIEELVEHDMLDLPINFVSTEFITGESDEGIRKWRNFFEQLGVDKKLEAEEEGKTNIAQRIAIKFVLHFEKTKGREAKPLTESERSRGFDIESESDSDERHIEVKGSRDYNPRITLTEKQVRTAMNEKDKYFFYSVGNVLKMPHLRTMKGVKLLEIGFSFMSIEPRKWNRIVEEEEEFVLSK